MSQAPPPGQQSLNPHRGTMILVFGILSWLVCCIFGIFAWIMGNKDLREMRAGTMDPSGETLTNVGRILGMINVILAAAGAVIGVIILIIIAIGGAMQ